MDEETRHWIAFSVFPGIGPVRFKHLLDYFGSAKKAWEASPVELKQIKLGDALVDRFVDFRKTFSLSFYCNKLAQEHVSVLTLNDSRYPNLLKQISDPPFVLYIKGKRGETPIDLQRTIGVVGTRKMTNYGADVTKRLVADLVLNGFTIVSGLAYGVDAVAHQSALDAGGKTVAVLGCGIDIIAPPSNARLYTAIAQGGGAIVSEMPLGLRPNKGLFPARNRIISGLSLGVIVTEGANDSGSLITARYAAEQGREVFAVPGPITSPYSKGPASLIKKGAKLVERVEDILEELNIKGTGKSNSAGHKASGKQLTADEQIIMKLLADRQMHIDELVRVTGLTSAVTASTLTILEMMGIVKDFGGKVYGVLP